MIKLVRGQDNIISLHITSTYPVGEVSGTFVAKSVTIPVPQSRNGTEIKVTAADVEAIGEDFMIGVMTLKNEANEEVAVVRVPLAVLPEGSDNRGFTDVRITLVSIREVEGGDHGGAGVKMFPTKDDFPVQGNVRYIYLAEDTGKMYRWDAAAEDYVEVSGIVHANLAENNPEKDGYVLNRQTSFLYNDGWDGTHPYASVANFVPDYDPETTYSKNDVVFHEYETTVGTDNGIFKCLADGTNVAPPAVSNWIEIDLKDLLVGNEVIISDDGKEPTDGEEIWIDESETPDAPSYDALVDKPLINGNELTGNKTSHDLGIADTTDLDKIIQYGYYSKDDGKFYKTYDKDSGVFSDEIKGQPNRLYVDISDEITYRWNTPHEKFVTITYSVDEEFNDISTNPVQNKKVTGKFTETDVLIARNTANIASNLALITETRVYTDHGFWKEDTKYLASDDFVISHNEDIPGGFVTKYYKCIADCVGIEPPNADYWVEVGQDRTISLDYQIAGKVDKATIFAVYAQEKSYLPGNIVVKDDVLYKCKTAVDAGSEWDEVKWETTGIDSDSFVTDFLGKPVANIKANSSAFAPEYDAASAYSVGTIVYHDGNIYQCTTAIAEGGEAWNAEHWELRKLNDFFTELNGLLIGTIAEKLPYSLVTGGEIQDRAVNKIVADGTALTLSPPSAIAGKIRDFVLRIDCKETTTIDWSAFGNCETTGGKSWSDMMLVEPGKIYIYRFTDMGGDNLCAAREEIS